MNANAFKLKKRYIKSSVNGLVRIILATVLLFNGFISNSYACCVISLDLEATETEDGVYSETINICVGDGATLYFYAEAEVDLDSDENPLRWDMDYDYTGIDDGTSYLYDDTVGPEDAGTYSTDDDWEDFSDDDPEDVFIIEYPSSIPAGTYQPELEVTREDSAGCANLSNKCTLNVVKVGDVVKDSILEESGPLYACINDSVDLKAKIYPSTASWPTDNEPSWEVEDYPTGTDPEVNPSEDSETTTLSGLTKLGEYVVRAKCGSNDIGKTITVNVVDWEKIPLGSSASLSKYILGKVYVPTTYGGTLELTGGSNLELFYTDGSDLTCLTATQVFSGECDDYIVDEIATDTYEIPEGDFGWYYVKITDSSSTSVSSEFTQSKTVTKSPWACPWYPMSDEQTPNLYESNRCLDKYDTAYYTTSLLRERRNKYFESGHFVAKNIVKEADAERTWGHDIDGDGSSWDDWEADYEYDFWNAIVGNWGTDNNFNAELGVSNYGHCGLMTAVIILHDEPSGNYNAPNGVVFTEALKKGLLVALYHGASISGDAGPDLLPHEWHAKLELRILGTTDGTMFTCDIHNSGTGIDGVTNCPIYAIDDAKYVQKPGQTNEKLIQITSQIKAWSDSAAHTLYYKYNVLYNASGLAHNSVSSDWLDHPSAPTNEKKPDSVWDPVEQTSIDSFWNGELDYDTIATIIPLD